MDIIAGYDVIVDGADNFPTPLPAQRRLAVKLHPRRARLDLPLRGPGHRLRPDARAHATACMIPEPPPPSWPRRCAEAGVLGVLPGIIGSIQAIEAIKLLLDLGDPLDRPPAGLRRPRAVVPDVQGPPRPRVPGLLDDPATSSSPSTTSTACPTEPTEHCATEHRPRPGPNLTGMADEERRTDSGIEIRPAYSSDDLAGWDAAAQLGAPGKPPYTAASTRRCTAAVSGRCANTPASAADTNPTRATTTFSRKGRPASRWHLICPPRMGRDSDPVRKRWARSAASALPIDLDSTTWPPGWAGCPLDTIPPTSDDHQRHGGHLAVLCTLPVAEEQGVGRDALRGTVFKTTIPEGVHRAGHLHLSARAFAATHQRRVRVCAAREVPRWNTISVSGYHMREAGCDAIPRGGVHTRQRHRIRDDGGEGRAQCRRVPPGKSASFSTVTTT